VRLYALEKQNQVQNMLWLDLRFIQLGFNAVISQFNRVSPNSITQCVSIYREIITTLIGDKNDS
jgi:hypothetical protein